MARTKYMLIDVTKLEETKILLVAPLKEVQAHGRLAQATGREVIAPPVEGRGFSKLEKGPLQYLFWNTFGLTPPEEYTELVKAALTAAEAIPVDETPLRELEAKVEKLAPASSETRLTPKEPKDPNAPAQRPAANTTTGLVWILADEVYAANPNLPIKELRTLIIAKCEEEGIKPATAQVQYAKWKGSKFA